VSTRDSQGRDALAYARAGDDRVMISLLVEGGTAETRSD
jgi:hypothetical protein